MLSPSCLAGVQCRVGRDVTRCCDRGEGGSGMSEDEDLCFMPATEMAARIRRRALSPVEAVEAFLTRIGARNSAINAYVTVIADQARAAARAAERAVMSGAPLGPLHGLPIAIKALYDFKAGVRNTCSANPLANYV